MEGRVSVEPAQRVIVRKKQRFFDAKLLYHTGLAAAVVALVYLHPPGRPAAAPAPTVPAATAAAPAVAWRELGHELATRELWHQALDAYQRYLDTGAAPPAEAANLCFRMGDIAKDKMQLYDRAAGYYLRVRHYDAKSPSLDKVGLRVVACLDALGNRRQSQQELDGLTNVDSKGRSSNPLSPIVAQLGSRDFTVADVDEGIAKLPPQLQKLYQGTEGRLRFLREHLLMPYVLYEAGRRQGLDKDARVVAQIAEVERNLVASTVIQKHLEKLGPPTKDEVELFYKAEQDRYRQPASRTFSVWTTATVEAAAGVAAALRQGAEVAVRPQSFGPVTAGTKDLPGLAGGADVVAVAFATKPGEVSEPVRAGEGYAVVRTDGEEPGFLPPLEQVGQQVAADLAGFRRNQAVQKLLDEQVTAQQIRVDPTALAMGQSGGGE